MSLVEVNRRDSEKMKPKLRKMKENCFYENNSSKRLKIYVYMYDFTFYYEFLSMNIPSKDHNCHYKNFPFKNCCFELLWHCGAKQMKFNKNVQVVDNL